MSLTLHSLRSHFIKHLTSCESAAGFFSFRRRVSHLTPRNRLLSLSAVKSVHGNKLQKIKSTPINYSTVPLNDGTVSNNGSFTSPYLSVRICCPRHASDMLSESLLCFGAGSSTIDVQDIHESGEEVASAVFGGEKVGEAEASPCISRCKGKQGLLRLASTCFASKDAKANMLKYYNAQVWISSTFDVSQDVKDCISRAADSVGLKQMLNYEVEMRDHIDWIKLTQESFHPVEISEGLWIVPEWREPPNPQAINIILNPGLAFGTGEHPTTKLCLLLLHRLIKGGEYFLDYGTGSGVLAIAALKFGAALSVGFDIEPQSITSARHNATLNGIGVGKLRLSLVPSKKSAHFENELPQKNIMGELYDSKIISEKEKYDVVIANILLYPLLDLTDRIVSYAKPGAIVGLSGIISEQVPLVIEHYSPFLDDINVSTMDGWACISGTVKAKLNNS